MAVLTRRDKGVVEIYKIPEGHELESQLAHYKIESVDIEDHKEVIEIYKMEYQRCAQRYNDLYSAAWTNFSYMALVAGGLLTFGGSRFVTPLTAFLACLPLLFWWFATFEPLNRYGDLVESQIVEIEKALNDLCISPLTKLPESARNGLSHFREFAERGNSERSGKVRSIILILAGSIVLIFLLFALSTFLNIDHPTLLTLSWVLLIAIVVFSFTASIGKGRADIKLALKEFGRVRLRVRVAALILLSVAICFGVKVWQLQRSGQPLTVAISKTAER